MTELIFAVVTTNVSKDQLIRKFFPLRAPSLRLGWRSIDYPPIYKKIYIQNL